MRFFFVHIATVSYKLRFIRLASFDILDEDERDPRFMHLLKANFFCFWKRQKEEILCSDIKRKHELPISGIRGAIKSNDQVKKQPLYLHKVGVRLRTHHPPQTPLVELHWVSWGWVQWKKREVLMLFKGRSSPVMINLEKSSSFMELPKSSSAPSLEKQRSISVH
ncbi:uncharacterized protein LOC132046674 isoform X1 [Lycium ferocissimum]|uniref:uncharacterized protein LOC132046674 isoform X1 n=1 Tax=Lycium ferocissimum TaxID=112874 RepID=UPI0028169970|nr:uncharacterized protein LOC132046674 isoform X1 [Lycium ferocissimum]